MDDDAVKEQSAEETETNSDGRYSGSSLLILPLGLLRRSMMQGQPGILTMFHRQVAVGSERVELEGDILSDCEHGGSRAIKKA